MSQKDREKIFGEGKYLFAEEKKMEMEKEENIWRMKIFFLGQKNGERKWKKKQLEKENICLRRRRKQRKRIKKEFGEGKYIFLEEKDK